jgi:site-specific DNA recombinase
MRCYARPKNAVSQIVTRKRRLSSGKIIGGIPFTKGPLAYLLKNRMYLGEINHGQQSYPGEHSAIVDRDLFEAVQGRLASQVHRNGIQALPIGSPTDRKAV